ncbi:TolC family protein [Arcobacter arenosus]|uniref:TolC family protein n=1 Tax=Arcobacter arenosus TaxID=2576037 RepID=A0A5R8Y1F4_9BACT|nr:TolC family protein [Arcobacter arenosus]TLP38392.1 TolC family protein [Arcobacter arenosus]
MFKNLVLVSLLVGSLCANEVSVNLDKAIETALKNNALNRISKLNLDIAKAQYEQALSANYPSIDAILYVNRDSKDTIYQQRGEFNLPADMVALLTPFGLSSTTINADIDTIAKGRDTIRGQVEVNYPIFTGGKISAIIEQARLNKEVKKQAIVREKANVVYDIKKYFYGYILTNELYTLIESIYKNMEFSRDITKEFLENGTELKINRSDYLNIKLLTSMIKSALSTIELNKEMLRSALANTMGLKHDDVLKIEYNQQEILKSNRQLQDLVKKASSLNPEINTINIALKIKDEQIKESKSDYYPMVNLFGNVSHTYNSYEYGYLNEDDENRWSLGLAVKMSLFNGFKTTNEVMEKKLDKKVMNEQKLLLEEGIALQLKNEFLKSSIGYEQVQTLKDAVNTAIESSDMNFKGYQYEMVEAEDLVKSQLMEVYVKSAYLKSVHDYMLSLATIDKLVGSKVDENF